MLAIAVLPAAYAGTLDLLDTTTLRGRGSIQITTASNASPPPAQAPLLIGIDLATAAAATLHLADRRWSYTLTYSPTLTAPDLENGFTHQEFQFASAVAAWHDRSTTVSLSGGASYGQVNSALLSQAQTGPAQSASPGQSVAPGQSMATGQSQVLQPIPTITTLTIGSLSGDLAVGQRLDRRARLLFSGGYFVSGGIDTQSRTVLPWQEGPHAAASFNYDLSPRDGLSTAAAAQEITTSGPCPPSAVPGQTAVPDQTCVEVADIAQLLETYRRRLSAALTLSVGGGVAVSRVRAKALDQTTPYPAAVASLGYHFGPRDVSELLLSAALAPVVDLRTGLVSNRAQENAALTSRLSPSVGLRASVGAVQSIPVPTPDPAPVTIFSASLDATFRVGRRFLITVGEQGIWQDQPGYGSLVSSFTYVALTVHAPTLRF